MASKKKEEEVNIEVFMTKIDGKLELLSSEIGTMDRNIQTILNDVKSTNVDQEQRLREVEKNKASKDDVKKAHQRIDELKTTIWKIIVYLAGAGAVTGGSITILKSMGM